ncbi:MAG TPA: hypothetical protein VME23_13540 [Terracidiphilus sp.]|nr:hypothetical protein [Terracidiphilus sp.]
MLRLACFTLLATAIAAAPLLAQTHGPRHSRYPNTTLNDPQLQIPADQAPSCFAPETGFTGYDQFEQFDDYQHPSSRGYLCIAIPPGKTFVIDHLFAEADYDSELPAPAEWYLDTTNGGYESMIGFAANRVGALTANPHYVLSEAVHPAVNGGTRVTLIMHNYFVNTSRSIGETPGTASLVIEGHWE